MLCLFQSVRVADATFATATTTPPPLQPAQRARRPTTLAYCERSVALPRVRRTRPLVPPPDLSRPQPPSTVPPKATAAVVTVAAEVIAAAAPVALPPPSARVVAPTATPEDSWVEEGSSSGVELDALPLDQSTPRATSSTAATATTVLSASTTTAQRLHDDDDDDRKTLTDTSCLDTTEQSCVRRLSSATDADSSSATQRPAPQRLVTIRRIHRVITGARQLGHRTAADDKPPAATTAFSEDHHQTSSLSSVPGVDDTASSLTSSRSMLGEAPAVIGVETDVCSSVGSSTVALSDHEAADGVSDTDTLAADVSEILAARRISPRGHRISPGRLKISPSSPSYDEKHARFSHVGAHALDVFFSPDDDDDDEDDDDECVTSDRSDSGRAPAAGLSNLSLWRPLASSGATLRLNSLSSLHVPIRRPAAQLLTSGLSVPEAVWRPQRVADERSLSVQGPSDDVTMPTSSLAQVLSPTEASESSTLAFTSAAASALREVEAATAPSVCRFVVIYVRIHQNNYI